MAKCSKCQHKGSLICYNCDGMMKAPIEDRKEREIRELMGHRSYKRKNGVIRQTRFE